MSATAPVSAASPLPRLLTALSVVLAVALAILMARDMWSISIPSRRLLQFDPASHGVHGVKMAQAIREHDARWFLALIEERVVWPPLLPLLEAPAFLLFGNTINVAEGLMAVLFALTIVAAYLGGRALGGARGVLAGALTAALLASSPFTQLFGAMIMGEMPGALLLLASVASYVRWRRLEKTRDLVVTCVCTTLLFFLKYNYALLWIVPVALNEVGHGLPAWPALVASARRLRPTPYRIVVVLAMLALAALVAVRFKGWMPESRHISLRLPALAVALLLILPALARPRSTFERWARAMGSWSPGARWFFWLTLVPAVLWLVSPTHVKGFMRFVVNREGQVPLFSVRSLTLYPDSFLHDYSPHPLLGAIVLALAAAALWRMQRWPAEWRIVPLAMAIGFFLCTVHRFKSPRFFFTVPPLIWLAAALALTLAIEFVFERRRRGAFATVGPALACAVLAVALAFGFHPAAARDRFVRATTPESLHEVLDAIADENVASRGTVLFGIWNRMSPGLTEWHQLLRHPDSHGPQRPMNPQWYPAKSPEALVDTLAADPGVERVLVLELPEGAPAWAPGFDEENPWIRPVRERLLRDARFTHERRDTFAATGYAMDVFRRNR